MQLYFIRMQFKFSSTAPSRVLDVWRDEEIEHTTIFFGKSVISSWNGNAHKREAIDAEAYGRGSEVCCGNKVIEIRTR